MNRNIANVERGVRIVPGVGLTALAFVGPQNLWFLLGLVPLATGLIGWCPPYVLLAIRTRAAARVQGQKLFRSRGVLYVDELFGLQRVHRFEQI